MGTPYRVERGTVTLPWGGVNDLIEVWSSDIGFQSRGNKTYTKLPDSGTSPEGSLKVTCPGDVTYGPITLKGVYTSGRDVKSVPDLHMKGSAVLQLASGETWSGDVVITSIRVFSQHTSNSAEVTVTLYFENVS